MPQIFETDLILNKDGSVYHLGLHPTHVSDTVITVGDPDRVSNVSKYFDRIDAKIQRREFVTHVGRLGRKQLTVISTGMGTDNIEILLTELDALVNVDLTSRTLKTRKKSLKIIRVGTSGSLQKDIPLDSHLASVYAVGLDNLMHFYQLKMTPFEKRVSESIKDTINLPFSPYVVKGSDGLRDKVAAGMIAGNTVTTPGFYAPQGRTVRLPPKYPRMLQLLASYAGKDHRFRLTNFEMETAGYYSLCRMLGHEALSVNAIIANRMDKKFSANPAKVVDQLIRKTLENCI
jgi:uridine phosphorylase